MVELWIKYKDENGEQRRVAVDKNKFVIGRHSSSDLCIPNGKLSREHLIIERSGDVFIASDLGSSNGTELNGTKLTGPSTFKHGDKADLGGGLEVEFEFGTDDPNAAAAQIAEPAADIESEAASEAVADGEFPPAGVNAPMAAAASASGGFPMGLLILAPLFGLLLLVSAIALIYFFSGGSSAEVNKKDDGYYHGSNDRDSADDSSPPRNSVPTSSPSTTTTSGTAVTSGGNTSPPPPANLNENARIEQSAAAFLRRIAQNDPNAFLTADQTQKVSGKIKQFGSSASLAENINSARKSASQIKSLATAKNLKPQLLATAALAKLGNSRGDVLQTAQSMADVLEKLGTQIGSELSDDSLLMIAAYDQGQAGDFMRMRNMLQDIATKFPESARSIRSIWFLQKQGKITDAEFDFALRFIAIGTITQSPKDFGVSTEPLTL